MAITKTQLWQKFEKGLEYGSIKVVIPTGDVLTLGTQYSAIAAPGAGKQIEVMSAITICASGTAYNTNTTIYIANDTATDPQFIDTHALLGSATARTLLAVPFPATTTNDTQIITNKALVIYIGGGNPATGTFQITLYIDYKIRTP